MAPMFCRPRLRHLPVFAALTLAGLLTGCDEAKISVIGSDIEIEHPEYVEGKRLQAEGKKPEALLAFTKVINGRREAPESHQDAGALCVELNLPLQAIYHYRCYLSLKPDAPQAVLVKQRIRNAEKEFLKTLPFTPLEGAADDRFADLMEKFKLLRRENDQLKLQLGAALANARAGAPPARPAVADTSTEGPAGTPATPAGTPPAGTTAATATARRTHVVTSGDTLARISQKYYNNKNRWKDIYNANHKVMKNDHDLKVGMVLVIP